MLKLGPKFGANGLRPEILLAILIAYDVANRFHKDIAITSGTDRTHSPKSLHYVGLGIDITWHGFRYNPTDDMSQEKLYASQIAQQLASQYDVVLEVDHVHIEFQPKEPR